MKDGKIVTDSKEMLSMWETHFGSLASSDEDGLSDCTKELNELNVASRVNEEYNTGYSIRSRGSGQCSFQDEKEESCWS